MATDARPLIEVRDLSAGYDKLIVLHELSLDIAARRFTAILGPNGSGKSTLLKSIFGLTRIEGGSIRLGERSLVGMATEAVGSCGIAYVPQRNNVFTAMTVRENLQLALRRMDPAAAQRLLDEVYVLFPILEQRQKQRAGQLSGGERQMAAIALGWLAQPQVMLLDEPTAGLSPLFTNEVFRTLKQLSASMALMVVEQNARSVLQWCDDVYILREGKLAFQGTAEACRADEETVKNYLGVGMGKKFDALHRRSARPASES